MIKLGLPPSPIDKLKALSQSMGLPNGLAERACRNG